VTIAKGGLELGFNEVGIQGAGPSPALGHDMKLKEPVAYIAKRYGGLLSFRHLKGGVLALGDFAKDFHSRTSRLIRCHRTITTQCHEPLWREVVLGPITNDKGLPPCTGNFQTKACQTAVPQCIALFPGLRRIDRSLRDFN
jgi:hypothetical protein